MLEPTRLIYWYRRSRDSKNHGPREDGPSLQQQANLVHYSQRHSGHASTYPPMMYPPPNGRFFPPGYPAYPPHPYGAGAYPPAAYGPYYQMYGGPMPSGYPAMGLGAHPSASTTSSPSESSRIKTVPSSPAAMSIDERPPATAMPVTTTQLEPAPGAFIRSSPSCDSADDRSASHFATTTLKVGSWAWRDSQEAPILTFDPAKDMLHYTHSEKGWCIPLCRVALPHSLKIGAQARTA